ncbi:MAG: hypothetical protein P4L10_11060 [Acidobacteriaceae bacterium]|nr:hypothetical protein [Acidobacteriaceae bacterium]
MTRSEYAEWAADMAVERGYGFGASYRDALARYDAAVALLQATPGDADDKYNALYMSGLEDCEDLATYIDNAQRAGAEQAKAELTMQGVA